MWKRLKEISRIVCRKFIRPNGKEQYRTLKFSANIFRRNFAIKKGYKGINFKNDYKTKYLVLIFEFFFYEEKSGYYILRKNHVAIHFALK